MHIAVIGAGNVGSTLGRRWARGGHHVVFGVRDPRSDKIQRVLAAAGPDASAASVRDAAAAAPIVLLATPWPATQDALSAAGDLTGKILIDATNPLQAGAAGLVIGHTTSGGEQVAEWAAGARVVKAFNSTGSGNMDNPIYPDGFPTMFLCGDDAEAKQTVAELTRELGFDVADVGGLVNARYLEPLAMLWIQMAYGLGNGPNIALRLMRREA